MMGAAGRWLLALAILAWAGPSLAAFDREQRLAFLEYGWALNDAD